MLLLIAILPSREDISIVTTSVIQRNISLSRGLEAYRKTLAIISTRSRTRDLDINIAFPLTPIQRWVLYTHERAGHSTI